MSNDLPADLPQHARERIQEMRAKKLFTSDLSVNEFVLVREAGFDPVGMVMGVSIYAIAPNIPRGDQGREVESMTAALYHARELAMNRMEEEAEALGADGIIGVRLTVNLSTDPNRQMWQQYRVWAKWAKSMGFRRPPGFQQYWPGWIDLAEDQWRRYVTQMGWQFVPLPPWRQQLGRAAYQLGPGTAEFMAIGTAVRHRTGEHYRNKKGKPFQSDLSGQDFWMLIRTGFRPVGFVMGNCVYYVPPALVKAPDKQSTELSAYTHALYDARELAIERLQDEAEDLDATGIVGVTIAEEQHSWRTTPWNIGNAALTTGELIELFVIGTAVVPTETGGELGDPQLILSANDVLPKKAAE
ncbi:MAG: heavy metal-binding domain-containing protein [Kofleriaceae bacterium]